MAKVQNNMFVRGLSGSLGDQFVVRKGKAGSTIISAKASYDSSREFNASQVAHQNAFREAIAYAKSAKTEEIYIYKAEGTAKNAYNVAVQDWFSQPEILEFDISSWNGQIGQPIRVKVQEEIFVAQVSVMIKDGVGAILEQGQATREDGLWWMYTTTTVISDPLTNSIVATAQDLPGNHAEMTWNN